VDLSSTQTKTGGLTVPLTDKGGQVFNVKAYGATGNGNLVADGAISSGSHSLTSSTANFSSADIGKLVVVFGAGSGGANLATTISSVTNSTTVVLTASAGTTVSGAVVRWGTDDTSAINSAITAAATSGGTVFFPQGVYCVGSAINTVPGAVWLQGTGFDATYPSSAGRPVLMSVICAMASMSYVLQLGSNPNSDTSGNPGASMSGLTVDAQALAASAVQTGGRRNRIMECYVIAGNTQTVNIQGQNTVLERSYISGEGMGNVVWVGAYSDHKILNNQIKWSGTSGYVIKVTVDHCLISGNHIWQGSNGSPTVGTELYLSACHGIVVTGNIFDSTLSAHITVDASYYINIVSNLFFQTNGVTDNTLSCISILSTGGGSITAVGNTVQGYGSSNRYKAFITSAASSLNRINVSDNVGAYVALPFSGFTPDMHSNNGFLNTTTVLYANNKGSSSQSGTGSATQFTIPHGLAAAPTTWNVTAASSAAAGFTYVTADATNLYVNYASAPASGTNNVVLNWSASL
jgi:hypothetical protein